MRELRLKNRISTLIIIYVLIWPAVLMYITPLFNKPLSLIGLATNQTQLQLVVNIIVLALCIISNGRYVGRREFYSVTLILIVIFIEFMIYGSKQFTVDRLLSLLLETVPYLIFAFSISEENINYKLVWKCAVVTLFINIIYTISQVNIGRNYNYENMDFAYNLLPSVLIILYGTIIKKKIIDWILGIISVIYIIMQGTRGPIFCLVAFILLVKFKEIGLKKAFIPFVAFGGAAIAFFESSIGNTALTAFASFIESRGFNARVINQMLTNSLGDDHGRAFIQEIIIKGIHERPIFGWGMFGDRFLTQGLYDYENRYSLGAGGTYSHNIVLEMLCDYGVIIGCGLFLFILTLVIRKYMNSSEVSARLIIVLICVGFIHLFMSGSYLLEQEFFFLIGICLRKNTKHGVSYKRWIKSED